MQPHQWYLLKLTSDGGLSPLPNFQKGWGDLTGSQILEGVDGKERCDVFQGELQLIHNALYVRFKSLVLTRLSFPTMHCLN